MKAWLMLVYFLKGQVLFVLAVALYIQTRRYSRLALARALPWLASYAFLETLYNWSALWTPPWVPELGWKALRAGLFGLSFLVLICAANQLWPSPKRLRALACWSLLGLGAAVWMGGLLYALSTEHFALLYRWGTWFLAFPAITLTAWTLRAHAQVHILPLGAPHLYRTLRFSGVAFFLYGCLLLLENIPLPTPAFRPEQLHPLHLLMLAVFVSGMLRGLDIFEVETRRRVEAMELAQARRMEREQLFRELHDGALQDIYAAGLWLQRLKATLSKPQQDEVNEILRTLNRAQREIRAMLMQADHEGYVDLDIHRALAALVEEARRISGAEISFHGETVPRWEAKRALHLLAFAREALANAIRHAHTPYIEVRLLREGDNIRLEIIDHGQGFSTRTARKGFGLRNMEERALLLGGQMQIDSQPGRGTRVVLTAPFVS